MADSRYLNTKEAADHIRHSVQTLANWRVIGDGPPFYKIGSRILYSIADLNSWVATQRKTNSQQT